MPPVGPCIYCRLESGPFSRPEHVFPEALGNREIILRPGFVCDPCNHGVLSRLDQCLVEYPPVEFLRVFNVGHTKSGKQPVGNMRNVRLERAKNGSVRVRPKDRSGLPRNIEKLADGRLKLTIEMAHAEVNPRCFARALYKVGLGVVAFSLGADVVLDHRFDLARDFVLGKSGFPNALLLSMSETMGPTVTAEFSQPPDPVVFMITLMGLICCFSLEPEPKMEKPPGVQPASVNLIPLATHDAC